MTTPTRSFDSPDVAAQPATTSAEQWPLAARASLVTSLCGLFLGGLGAAVLHMASR